MVYRGKFMEGIKNLIKTGEVLLPGGMEEKQLLTQLYSKEWVVYAKAPLGGQQMTDDKGERNQASKRQSCRICRKTMPEK